MTNSALDKQIEHRLQEREIRYTKGRKTVVDALTRVDGPLSATEIHTRVEPAMPLSSLYRSLTVLEEAGVLVPHFGQGVTRYELAEWLTGHHHHLVCVDCGSVDDIELPEPLEARVGALVDEIGGISAFQPTDHALEIEGRCARCA